LPAVIKLRDNTGARFSIAGVALVILIGAIAFSKRKTTAMDADIGGAVPASEAGEVVEAALADEPVAVAAAPARKAPAKKAPAKKVPAQRVAAAKTATAAKKRSAAAASARARS